MNATVTPIDWAPKKPVNYKHFVELPRPIPIGIEETTTDELINFVSYSDDFDIDQNIVQTFEDEEFKYVLFNDGTWTRESKTEIIKLR